MQKWIRLFQINERSFLEEQLNRFLSEHKEVEIKVWTEDGMWYAQAIYTFGDRPTYPEASSENQ
jgi:hypothetical protein